MDRFVYIRFLQFSHWTKWKDITLLDFFLHEFLFEFRLDNSHLEVKILFLHDFFNDANSFFYVRTSTTTTSCTDQYRNTCFESSRNHDSQVTLHCITVSERITSTQVIWTRVSRTSVNCNHMRLATHTFDERFFRETVTKDSGRRKHADFIHIFSIHELSFLMMNYFLKARIRDISLNTIM